MYLPIFENSYDIELIFYQKLFLELFNMYNCGNNLYQNYMTVLYTCNFQGHLTFTRPKYG